MKRGIYGIIALCLVLFCFVAARGYSFRAKFDKQSFNQSGESEPLLSEIIERERAKWGIPKGIIEGQIWHESKFDETAFNPEKHSREYRRAKTKEERERAGAHGLLQTRAIYHGGHRGENVSAQISRGVRFLGTLYAKHRSISVALERYNGRGPAAKRYARAVIKEARHFGYQG